MGPLSARRQEGGMLHTSRASPAQGQFNVHHEEEISETRQAGCRGQHEK